SRAPFRLDIDFPSITAQGYGCGEWRRQVFTTVFPTDPFAGLYALAVGNLVPGYRELGNISSLVFELDYATAEALSLFRNVLRLSVDASRNAVLEVHGVVV